MALTSAPRMVHLFNLNLPRFFFALCFIRVAGMPVGMPVSMPEGEQ